MLIISVKFLALFLQKQKNAVTIATKRQMKKRDVIYLFLGDYKLNVLEQNFRPCVSGPLYKKAGAKRELVLSFDISLKIVIFFSIIKDTNTTFLSPLLNRPSIMTSRPKLG